MRIAIACVYLLATLVTGAAALAVWRERHRAPIAAGFAAVLASGSLWSGLVLAENVEPFPGLRVAALHVWFLAPRLTALAFGLLTLRLFDVRLPRLARAAQAHVVVAALVLALPASRALVVHDAQVGPDGVLRWNPGPLFWAYGLLDLSLFVALSVLLGHAVRHAPGARRRQLLCVLGSGLVVVAGVLAALATFVGGSGTTDGFDFTVLGFVTTAVLYLWWLLTNGALARPPAFAGLRSHVVAALPVAVLVIDSAGRVVDANDRCAELLGAAPASGGPVRAALDHLGPEVLPATGEYHLPGEGGGRDIRVVASPLVTDGGPLGAVLLLWDATVVERRRRERLEALHGVRRRVGDLPRVDDGALRDPLTGFANRRHLLDCLDAIVTAAVEEGRACAVVRLCLDPPPGRAGGEGGGAHGSVAEHAIVAVARHVERCAPPGAVLGRLPGAGLAVVLPDADAGDARRLVTQVRSLLAEGPGSPRGAVVAAGIAVLTDPGVQPYRLLADADEALARSRLEGGGVVVHGA